MFEEENILLSQEHPPTEKTVKIIEKYLSGIIYDDQHIYLNSEHTIEEIASTMVHESCHFLNSGIYKKEKKNASSQIYKYADEVRSFTAEKIFERNGKCLRRSDIKKIHEQVTRLYPEFIAQDVDTQKLGYIFSSYDAPRF